MEDSKIIIYQTEDGQTQIDVRLENDTVWLTQMQIAELFGTKRPAITKHLKNIYDSEELDEKSTCSILEHMGNDGKRTYVTKYYNLDAILSIGYRVNSKNATRFRQWSNKVLKQFLIKGYAVNQRIHSEQMAELFQKDRTVITRHINNVFKEGELEKSMVCAKIAHTFQRWQQAHSR